MSNVENVCPQVLRGVARELRRLAERPPAGVKLLLRDDDLTDVVALIEGPAGTPYAGGVFRVRLVLGREFPASAPRAFFETRIFHPNVAAAGGAVCVNTLQRDWRPELGLEHALLALRCLLIAPNPESALNAEAAALLRDHYDLYFARAKLLADIHARPQPPADDRAESLAEGEPANSAKNDAHTEGGPCAKRERRPVSIATGAGTGPGSRGAGTGPGSKGVGTGPGSGGAGTGPGSGGASTGSTGPGAGGARSAAGAPRPAPAKDKDRRRILKRL